MEEYTCKKGLVLAHKAFRILAPRPGIEQAPTD